MSLPVGATAVGVKAKGGVVLAADKRMSYGGFIVSRNAKKVFVINDRVGIAIAGFYADISGLSRLLEAEVRYYESINNRRMPLRSVAKLLSTILYSSKILPFYVEAIVGGIDYDEKPRIYVLDPVGAVTEEDFVATGTGATMALGVIESLYKPDMTVEQAEELVSKAMRAAMSRDSGSGDGMDILTITESEGVKERTLRFRVVEG